MSQSKHIVIIGAGPGGYVAAIRAAQLGAQVTVVENQALGGVCLNSGCIPSKALLSVIELSEKLKKAEDLGLTLAGPTTLNPTQMVERKNRVVTGLVKGIATLFKGWGVTHIEGTGSLQNDRTVDVQKADGTSEAIQADAVILATGSSWPNLPLFPINGTTIITSKEALEITRVPEHLLIVGGGVEGCEFASLYSGLGSKVSIVEMMSRLLPLEDEEVSALIERELKKRKVQFYLGTKVEKVTRSESATTVTLENGTSVDADMILVSIGRRFNTSGLGLEKVGVQLGQRGEISINDRMETNVPGVYAIGDVVGKAMLAHVASAQGKVAVENIMGHEHAIDYNVIPAGIFTLPEVGRVGLTEQQVREQGIEPKVGRFRFAGLGKSHAIGDTIGFAKVIAHPDTDAILGAHLVGAHAADLVHEAAMAMQMKATATQMAEMIHAHPTQAEGLMEAAEDVHDIAIHQAPKRLGT
ncbi:MAG: dihydrolipoyl dehydrogenase [Nitrospirae bacterium]|nr:dihydrolipoyl dehydrogenase [Nitrospirota bacterium]MDA1304491.1 dihydrolipoyl dehydrogenase [Nitrospirota bacterium]